MPRGGGEGDGGVAGPSQDLGQVVQVSPCTRVSS